VRGTRAWLSRYWDIRPGEGRFVVLAFAALLLIVSAHTVLETARDALLLTRLPPRQLGVVYIAVAAVALPVAALAGRAVRLLGARTALTGSLLISTLVITGFFAIHMGPGPVIGLYVATGAIITAIVPQFWTLIEAELTTAQARRLVSPITSAGIAGGVIGSAAAAGALLVLRVKALLLVSALMFVLAAAVVVVIPLRYRTVPAATKSATVTGFFGALREEPFLKQVALLVAASTATLLALDYFFKWTVANTVPHAQVGMLVARVYAALNVASLVLQLVFGAALVRRVGLVAAVLVTPVLLLFGASGAFVLGGALVVVVLLKGIDGSLRYSVHRITTELLYLPIRSDVRGRAKPLIDGALVRTIQAVTAGVLLGISGHAFLTPRLFAAIVLALGFAWAVIAVRTRRPYMDLLRRTVIGSSEAAWAPDGADPLDLATAEVLVEFLARDNPTEVLAAMDALSRRGHGRLIPALILHHEDDRVLVSALEQFGASPRTDWHTLARRLLDRPRERVRMAAARALAMHRKLETTRLAGDPSSRVEAYATLYTVLADDVDPASSPRITALLRRQGGAGEATRLGLLAALADAPATPRATTLLLELTRLGPTPDVAEWTTLVARATAKHGVTSMIPLLFARLHAPGGREEVLRALVALGDPALEAAWAGLRNETTERRQRAQLPNVLARFGTKHAALLLLEGVETVRDHLIRYRSIRALGRVASDTRPRRERVRVERQAYADLIEHFAVLGRRVALDVAVPDGEPVDPRRHQVTGILLRGLLDDKLRHSVERTFRLLKIAHPAEDIHRVQMACLSDDLHARANAGEFLDALLTRHDQQPLRGLLRLISDNLSPAERLRRAAPVLPRVPPRTHDQALRELVEGPNTTLAALAAQHALSTGGASLLVVEDARAHNPDIDAVASRLFEDDEDDATSHPPSLMTLVDHGRHGG
jgi:AAA family ATP:ADP antiporter